MYLRTPKRYSARGKKRQWINWRWAWLWLLTPIVALVGLYIYNEPQTFAPPAQEWLNERVNEMQSGFSTAVAPTALPTEDPTERRIQADNAWRLGSIDEAVRLYMQILPALPNDLVVHYQVTLGLIIQGRYADALQMAERTVNADPYASDAWAIRALALDRNRLFGEAAASALYALDLNPENASAMSFLAEAYYDLGQYDRAQATVERALEMNPDYFYAYRVRALIYQTVLYDTPAAYADYEMAFNLAPNLVLPAVELALMEIGQGNYEDALAMLEEVIQLNPSNTSALHWIGYTYRRFIGDPNQAADFLGRCIQIDPNNIDCNYELGRALIQLERFEEAADHFLVPIEQGTDSPYHYFWAGYSRILIGNCPAALPYLRTGYDLALEQSETAVYTDFEDALRECQAGVPFEQTPEATAESG